MPMDCPTEKSVADETDGSMDDGFATLVNRFCEEQVALRARLAGGRVGDADGGAHPRHS